MDEAVEGLTLSEGEHVVLVAHRHWINVLPFFVSTGVVIAAGFLLINYVGTRHGASSLLPGVTLGIITPVVALIDVFAMLILLFAYIVYRQNKIVLTNIHFVEITQTGLFGRSLSKLSLNELEDVRGTRHGVFGTLLNYGDILIETAAAQENFLFRPVSDPLTVAEKINDQHEMYESRHIEEVEIGELGKSVASATEEAREQIRSQSGQPQAPTTPQATPEQPTQPSQSNDQQPPSEFPPSAFTN